MRQGWWVSNSLFSATAIYTGPYTGPHQPSPRIRGQVTNQHPVKVLVGPVGRAKQTHTGANLRCANNTRWRSGPLYNQLCFTTSSAPLNILLHGEMEKQSYISGSKYWKYLHNNHHNIFIQHRRVSVHPCLDFSYNSASATIMVDFCHNNGGLLPVILSKVVVDAITMLESHW